jgi:DNA repair exonuclease SbcCD ATPase subunit
MGQPHRPTKFPSDEGSECSSVTSDSIGRFARGQETGSNQDSLKALYKQLTVKQEEIEGLKDKLDQMKSLPQEIAYLHAALQVNRWHVAVAAVNTSRLQEERFRTERLEEQINDLTELHQNEVENLKQAMADMEEKVQYQSEERLRDIHEILEQCQTKVIVGCRSLQRN